MLQEDALSSLLKSHLVRSRLAGRVNHFVRIMLQIFQFSHSPFSQGHRKKSRGQCVETLFQKDGETTEEAKIRLKNFSSSEKATEKE
ncbi:hypothetical protein FACS1894180_0060 [Bacteroidia bacterium]|nr:hypothetical protein FACS1894180_0060 [Bacteroidia bacterium]